MRSRVPIRGGTAKSILTGQTAQTVVQQTIVQQVKGGTSGVGGIASTIWPLIGQIPVNVVDIAALTTPGLVVDTGSHIIARTLTVNAPPAFTIVLAPNPDTLTVGVVVVLLFAGVNCNGEFAV